MAQARIPPRTYGAVGFVGFHACLVVAAACCYVSCLFAGMVLELADLPQGALAWMGRVVGPVATAFLCVLLARRLRRLPAVRALLTTGICAVGCLLMLPATVVLVSVFRPSRYELRGPDSPTGLRTRVAVRDAGPGWSADFYSDVTVLDANDTKVAEWKDHSGQYPRGGPEKLRDSMRWIGAKQLEFRDNGEPVVLEVK